MKIFDFVFSRLKNVNLIIIASVIAVTPLIYYLNLVTHYENVAELWGSSFNYDFSSFYKMNWLIFINSLLFIVFTAYIIKFRDLIKTCYYIPLSLFAVLAVVSTYLSEYPDVVVRGFPNRYASRAPGEIRLPHEIHRPAGPARIR